MALAKWFGQPSSSGSSSGAACPPATGCAKTMVINKAEHKQFGLENFGNTCYVNSVLQALYFCHPFRALLIQSRDRSNPSVPSTVYSSPSPPSSSALTNSRAKNQRKLSSAEVSKVSDGTTPNGTVALTGPPIPSVPPNMFSALRALFIHISDNSLEKGVVAPRAFVDKLKKENELFRSTMHQDAHEFLIFLINKIAEDLEEEARNARSGSSSGEDLSNSIKSVGPSMQGITTPRTNSMINSNIVHDLFEGVLTSETRCLTCETVSARDEAFLDLSIDIEQNSSVTACLRQFSASEMLCQKNKFFCDSCCGLQEAEKRMKIKRLPNVLALHLKRFKYQEDVGKYIKLAYRVAFPLELRLFNTADDAEDPDRLYELISIVVHIGNGPHHGHYIAIVKSLDTWFVFDDDSVEEIKESDISKYFGDSNSGAAYVLLYQALDLDPVALGLKTHGQSVTESTAEASPLQGPLLPPGLTHEGDSDASEIAPTTPASPASHSVPSAVPGSPPPVHITIPPPEPPLSIPIPIATPTASSPNAKSTGFFNSIRHIPSKPSLSSGSHRGTQDTNSTPVPPLPSFAGSSQTTSEPSEASASASSSSVTSPVPNGKPKGPREKTSTWFTRKRSVRPETAKSSDHGRRPATSSGTREHHDGGSLTSSSSSSRVPIIPDNPPKPSSSTTALEASPLLPTLSISPKSPQEPTPTPVPQFAKQSGIPMSLASPSSHSHDHSSHHHFHLPGHKKSQPTLSASPPTPESRTLPAARPPKRPSTAGATTSSTKGSFSRHDEFPPLPPLSSELRSPIPRPRTAAYDPSVPKEEREHRRLSTQVTPTTPLKRASRKLSLTGSMLGFVRKEKEKEKHRNGEHLAALSPTVETSSATPGMSSGGRL